MCVGGQFSYLCLNQLPEKEEVPLGLFFGVNTVLFHILCSTYIYVSICF